MESIKVLGSRLSQSRPIAIQRTIWWFTAKGILHIMANSWPFVFNVYTCHKKHLLNSLGTGFALPQAHLNKTPLSNLVTQRLKNRFGIALASLGSSKGARNASVTYTRLLRR
jgi:hypothetical protein